MNLRINIHQPVEFPKHFYSVVETPCGSFNQYEYDSAIESFEFKKVKPINYPR